MADEGTVDLERVESEVDLRRKKYGHAVPQLGLLALLVWGSVVLLKTLGTLIQMCIRDRSRAVSKERLQIVNFDPRVIKANAKVKQFYQTLEVLHASTL